MIDAQAQLFSPKTTHTIVSGLVNQYMTTLNDNNIECAVLLQPIPFKHDNHLLLDALKKHPKRLRGFVMVEPTTSLHDLQQLQASGVVGVRVHIPQESPVDWHSLAYQRLLENLEILKLHLSLNQSVDHGLTKSLRYLSTRHIQVIVEALGQPNILEGIHGLPFQSMLATCFDESNLWFNVSGFYQATLSHQANIELSIAFAMALMKAIGPSRLLWGSDWPFVDYQDQSSFKNSMLWFSKNMHVSESELHDMMHANAERLYGFASND